MLIVLGLLFVCHFLGDFVFPTKKMLAAKKFGEPLAPIIGHALLHAGLMLFVIIPLIPFGLTTLPSAIAALLLQLGSHTLIDFAKGKVTKRFNLLDISNPRFWWLFGFDQFLHSLIIIGMIYILFYP